ncbi:MAG TPA: phage terminase large subunit [Chloroflexota bacterium]|nr:phage terminase large subunit [Chloroflexota bacterium]
MATSIALDLATALDPCLLARKCGLEPDPWQRRVLRSAAPRVLLNITRQGGKSTTTALLGLHSALYTPDMLVLMVSPSLRQSGEIFRKALAMYRQLGRPVPSESETALTLTLANGSRIVSLPGSDDGTIRGYSGVGLLILDEASRVSDAIYNAVVPMIAVSGGRVLALSTPWGKRGWWYEAWIGEEEWERYAVPAEQCPRISPEFLAGERRRLAPALYLQEYGCTFADTIDQMFTYDVVMGAITPDVQPLFGVA